MDYWDDLKFLLAVNDAGTMSGAARALNTNVATVSRRIDRLSQKLEVEVLIKTPDGWIANPEVEGMIASASAFSHELKREQNRMLFSAPDTRVPVRIGAPIAFSTYMFTPYIKDLLDALPNVTVELYHRFFEEGLGDNDIVVVPWPPKRGRLITRKAGTIMVGVYGKKGGSRTGPWIGLQKENERSPQHQMAMNYFREPPTIRMDHFNSVLEGILKTGMPGPLPSFIGRSHDDLVELTPPAQMVQIQFWLCYHQTRRHDPVIDLLVEWVISSIRKSVQKSDT
ncbi:hypothetical protein BV394_02230 [Brevirhabdus pacifica]|uniref:Uncharacterized protein n=1 Tax=Brevirhabdus pacifica TaxID=1267768 RepID=A0A1U7DFC0_9RHOB|nr:LysR family transcriptional regulator [Brevirhabdus pacifica]APX88694.1 hypothetical protein BV394_02230 [Brevirhabdus pacifica]OWU79959.1 hypothetical protein ATO5_02910 [Loktanella sp. 22II-4b]PJJ86795.1 DNA-binding transcriptional LysR family regulator [Brevirhabdus pacifica]